MQLSVIEDRLCLAEGYADMLDMSHSLGKDLRSVGIPACQESQLFAINAFAIGLSDSTPGAPCIQDEGGDDE